MEGGAEVKRANIIKVLSEVASALSGGDRVVLLETIKDLERMEKLEQIINDPVNRAVGSVSIKEIREVLG